jgi:hypothetical protein
MTFYRLACSIVLGAAVTSAPGSASADPELSVPRWQLGVGAGGSWLPEAGGTATLLAEASVGLDIGRFGLRAVPSYEYFTIAEGPSGTMSVGYVAVEGVFRVTPYYAVSVAPLAGYSYAPIPPCGCPGCFDAVCYDLGTGNGLTLGATASPATLTFGPDNAFEASLRGVLFEWPNSGHVYLGTYVALRWFFLGSRG